jgi:ketosteroid isomerase-like protein
MNVKQMANHWMDRFREVDSDAFTQCFAEDGSIVDPAFGLVRQGRDLVQLHHRKWHAAVPDFKADVERLLVDGQSAVFVWYGSGTFTGAPLGPGDIIQPTHKPFKTRAILVLDFEANGLVKTCTAIYDSNIMPRGGKGPYADDPLGLA